MKFGGAVRAARRMAEPSLRRSDMDTVPEQRGRGDKFDRLLGSLVGIPGVLCSAPTTVRSVTPIAGTAETFIVQTYRQRDEDGDGSAVREYVFLEYVDDGGSTRLVIPPAVTKVIIRQHDSLIGRARKAAAKTEAARRKARGIVPGFMRNRKHKARKVIAAQPMT
jgi:hypothetical protein